MIKRSFRLKYLDSFVINKIKKSTGMNFLFYLYRLITFKIAKVFVAKKRIYCFFIFQGLWIVYDDQIKDIISMDDLCTGIFDFSEPY